MKINKAAFAGWRNQYSVPVKRNRLLGTLFAIAILSFGIVFFYLGGSAGSCTTTLASGPGDQTGLIWLNSVVNAPFWGLTDVSNAPYGENLRSPVHITGAIVYGLYWLVAQFVGSVCGYNLLTAGGLLFSGLVVFFFTRSLTNRNDVAIFASVAATITPYLQIKTGVHASYAFFGVFVILIWLAINLWRRPSKKRGLALGLMIASLFYIDPYFTLLGGVVIATMLAVFIALLLRRLYLARAKKADLNAVIKASRSFVIAMLLAGVVAASLGLAPLVIMKHLNSAQIDKEVAGVRADIKQEVTTYSARPSEYLPPNPYSPYISSDALPLPGVLTRKAHGSNPSEDVLSLSLVVLILSAATVGILVYTARNKQFVTMLGLRQNYVLATGLLLAVAIVALLVSMPPQLRGFVFPSEVITNYVTIWRVFARLGLIVAICLAIVAAIGLAMVTNRLQTKGRFIVVALLTLLVGFEYLTFTPFNNNRSWSYSQVHPFYYWLKEQGNIDIVAEYPFDEPGRTNDTVAYFRDQYVHGKKIMNAYKAANEQTVLRNGLRDLSDPQTVPALAFMGVDLIIVHAQNKQPQPSLPGLQAVDWNNSDNDSDSIYANGRLHVYRVVAEKDDDGLVLVPGLGFDQAVLFNQTYTEAGYVFKTSGELKIIDLATGRAGVSQGQRIVSFKVAASTDNVPVLATQAGQVVWQGIAGADAQLVEVAVDTAQSITLWPQSNDNASSIIITDINLH